MLWLAAVLYNFLDCFSHASADLASGNKLKRISEPMMNVVDRERASHVRFVIIRTPHIGVLI